MITMKLGGKELRCEKPPLGPIFSLSEALDSKDEMRSLAAMSRFVRSIVIEEDRALLEEVLNDSKLMITFTDLMTAVGEVNSGRPFTSPSPSSTGSEPTRRSSKVVSLSRGTVKVEPPSNDGTSVAS